jgi:zinc transporter 9
MTLAHVLWWHSHVQPIIDRDRTRADRGWNWLLYVSFTTLAGTLLARRPAGYTVGIVVRELSSLVPCALVQLVGRFPALEDAAACLGVLIALAGVLLTHFTGNPIWDALASISIGLLLGVVAVWLIARNSHLLVGPAIPEESRQLIRNVLASHPTVERVVQLRTLTLDASTYGVAADVEFAGDAIAERLENHLRDAWPEITDYQSFQIFAADYADKVVDLVGDEVDAVEAAIRAAVPQAEYLDIETD